MREPYMIVATGTKGVGKTYRTCHIIEDYIKDNPASGQKARKVLIYDVNREYVDTSFAKNGVSFTAPILALKDLGKWSRQDRVEVRRIVPIDEKGNILDGDEQVVLLENILKTFKGGLLILEDINSYLIGNSTKRVIASMCTNRHKDLDIYIHLQSTAAITPRMFQNMAFLRMHKQSTSLYTHIGRIPEPELYLIAEKLTNSKYQYDERFFCHIDTAYLKIHGKFSLLDYQKACYSYILEHPKLVTTVMRRFSKEKDPREKAIQFLLKDLMKYYGNKISK